MYVISLCRCYIPYLFQRDLTGLVVFSVPVEITVFNSHECCLIHTIVCGCLLCLAHFWFSSTFTHLIFSVCVKEDGVAAGWTGITAGATAAQRLPVSRYGHTESRSRGELAPSHLSACDDFPGYHKRTALPAAVTTTWVTKRQNFILNVFFSVRNWSSWISIPTSTIISSSSSPA